MNKSILGKRKFPTVSANKKPLEALIRDVIEKISKKAFEYFPPIVFVHQLYGLCESRTWVDQQVGKLKNEGKLLIFKLEVEEDDMSLAVAFSTDILSYIKGISSSRYVTQFIDQVLPNIRDPCVEKTTLKNQFKLSEAVLRDLVHESILVIRDVGIFWISFPRAGEFIKTYLLGRKHLIRCLKKAKYSEMLEKELLKRNLPKKAILGMEYHILDLGGSEDVKCIQTTSGRAFRMN